MSKPADQPMQDLGTDLGLEPVEVDPGQPGWQRSSRSLREQMSPLLNSEHYSDVTLLVGLQPDVEREQVKRDQLRRFPAHQFLLNTASAVFEQLLQTADGDPPEVLVTDVDADIFQAMLR